jgi:hypothetical protein
MNEVHAKSRHADSVHVQCCYYHCCMVQCGYAHAATAAATAAATCHCVSAYEQKARQEAAAQLENMTAEHTRATLQLTKQVQCAYGLPVALVHSTGSVCTVWRKHCADLKSLNSKSCSSNLH